MQHVSNNESNYGRVAIMKRSKQIMKQIMIMGEAKRNPKFIPTKMEA